MSTVVTPSPNMRGDLTLIDAMLDEQGDLTAVERFTQFHEGEQAPLQGGVYSSLLPARTPGPGQQYAFEVDLDRCSGCKACVAACHSMNGLDEFEAWREVGLIVGAVAGLPVLQHVTSACHHCLDPACLSACPVDAYEKDPVTGIVKHLDDQCFGCQYCTLACPYDVPKFHAKKGIVRKCDMCSDRLGAGEAPACAQACPHEAIKIRVIDRAEAVAVAESNSFLATAPAANYTMPTTRYLSSRPAQGPVRAGDHFRNEPEHAHVPLVVMLVLTQASAGGYLVEAVARATGGNVPTILPWLSLVVGLVGINASLLHLGRPLYAYRALIGLRHSWLSREVAAFGLFANVALAHGAALWFRPDWLGLSAAAAAATGLVAVFCSVMVYHVVHRPFWRGGRCGLKFFGTSIVVGLAGALATSGGAQRLAVGLAAASLAKLAFETSILMHLRDPQMTPLRRTALLLRGPLAKAVALRLGLGLTGGVVLPLALATGAVPAAAAWVALAAVLGGELAERYLFFAAVVRPKMPGGLAS
ncbi:nitrate reductase (quinol-dependent), transmembrane subunit [Singulisphaera sp. GP187]|uniref:DmsC/YnfH family molybdoenzyme membrane anchor subunit n=1 Tax=Singulisphaera sp. GP187 TaxID=1882752 RepID=UPI0009287DF8|nr:DmsC/YnfH family molybdoenzyme membrane anchor subunit [Singulisphaera sp. GP187]SIO24747.1 nitrate reductase (quinol-dependent), transmembrane subunit [Singulisphaera sp. GP187]